MSDDVDNFEYADGFDASSLFKGLRRDSSGSAITTNAFHGLLEHKESTESVTETDSKKEDKAEVLPDSNFKTLIGLGTPNSSSHEDDESIERERRAQQERARKRARRTRSDLATMVARLNGENDWRLNESIIVTVNKASDAEEDANSSFSWISDGLYDTIARTICGVGCDGKDDDNPAAVVVKMLQYYKYQYVAPSGVELNNGADGDDDFKTPEQQRLEQCVQTLLQQLKMRLVPYLYVVTESFVVLITPGSVNVTPTMPARRVLRELYASNTTTQPTVAELGQQKSEDQLLAEQSGVELETIEHLRNLQRSESTGFITVHLPTVNKDKFMDQISKQPYASLHGEEHVQKLFDLITKPDLFRNVILLSPKPFLHSSLEVADIKFGTSLKFDGAASHKQAVINDTMTITSDLLPASFIHTQLLPFIKKHLPGISSDAIALHPKPHSLTTGFMHIKSEDIHVSSSGVSTEESK